ncbi:hypothetical protein JCM6882_005779 [Rhodosporidiobolus microsporus]
MPSVSTNHWNDHLLLKVVNILAFVFLFSSNTYGAFQPHSAGRETYFTPASYVFYTWTAIDLLLLGYVIYQFVDDSHDSIHGVGWRFPLIAVLNAIYVHVYVTRHFIVAFIFSLLLASSVSTVYYSLSAHYKPRSMGDVLFVHLPFSLWHAWSILTALISAFALFTHGHRHNSPSVITRVLVCIAVLFVTVTAVGYSFRDRRGDVAGAAVMSFFLWGLYEAQYERVIKYSALAGAIISTLAVVKSLWFTFASRDGAIALEDDERRPLVA